MLLHSINYGGGKDLWNVSKADYKKFTKLFHNLEIIARVGMFFTKASILLLFHRFFVVEGSRRTKVWWAIWFVFWWNLLYAIALVLSVAFQCTGKRAVVEAGKECVNGFAVLICASVINVTTDLMILIIPVVAIWGLRMPSEKKWRLSAVFAIGFLGVLASVARLAYQAVFARRPNKTIIIVIVLLVNAAEQFIGIIVSCLPVLPTFYRHLRSKAAESNSSKSTNPVNRLSASIIGRRTGGSKGKPKDPYEIYSTKGYEEIVAAELERRGDGHGNLGGIMKDMEMSVISEKRSPDAPGIAL
ncbi:hypothetical protein GJ744_005654 [Endocarpon pusillum]|uniref:Rhodopsin domain-containing protein n=1 Tax=Endocarpon pusillum TaxID=364733 RepID=A0A8H7DYA6_9EURO|nr:hypothetical protein GJ744_005654 [Endocarpon pusillum]